MDPEQLRTHLNLLNVTQTRAGRILGVSTRAIRNWLTGERSVPEPVAMILRYLVSSQTAVEDWFFHAEQ